MNNKNVLISVIVPVYNVRDYIEECVESILCQNFTECELILVNDGSTDGSGEICDSYRERSNVMVIHQRNSGHTAARQQGLRVARGKYITFVDSDDKLPANTIEQVKQKLKLFQPDIVWGTLSVYDEKGMVNTATRHVVKLPEGLITNREYQESVLLSALMNKNGMHVLRSMGGKYYRREAALNILNGIPEEIKIGEDMCFVGEACLDSNSIFYMEDCLYLYRRNNNSISHQADKDALSRCLILIKHLDNIARKNEKLVRDQFYRLVTEQIYSSYLFVKRTGNKRYAKRELKKLLKNELAREAVLKSRFSLKAKKQLIKKIILMLCLFG